MKVKDILENIDGLSAYVAQAKADIGELFGSYRALAENVDAAIGDADEAFDELGKLLEAIESGEVSIDEDTEHDLEDLLDMSPEVLQDISNVHKLYSDIEKASRVVSNAASTQRDIISLSQEMR